MVRLYIILAFIGLAICSFAQNSQLPKTNLSEGAKLLFRNIKTRLSEPEKNFVYQKLQVKLSRDKKSFELEGITVNVQVLPADMNKDGLEEMFVTLASPQLFGNTGQTVLLLIKDKTGNFQQQTEIVGGIPLVLSSTNQGYPDLVVAGPGMEHPSFRWNGKDYRYYKTVKDESPGNNATEIVAYSKAYTDLLK